MLNEYEKENEAAALILTYLDAEDIVYILGWELERARAFRYGYYEGVWYAIKELRAFGNKDSASCDLSGIIDFVAGRIFVKSIYAKYNSDVFPLACPFTEEQEELAGEGGTAYEIGYYDTCVFYLYRLSEMLGLPDKLICDAFPWLASYYRDFKAFLKPFGNKPLGNCLNLNGKIDVRCSRLKNLRSYLDSEQYNRYKERAAAKADKVDEINDRWCDEQEAAILLLAKYGPADIAYILGWTPESILSVEDRFWTTVDVVRIRDGYYEGVLCALDDFTADLAASFDRPDGNEVAGHIADKIIEGTIYKDWRDAGSYEWEDDEYRCGEAALEDGYNNTAAFCLYRLAQLYNLTDESIKKLGGMFAECLYDLNELREKLAEMGDDPLNKCKNADGKIDIRYAKMDDLFSILNEDQRRRLDEVSNTIS